jgi:hypothetical protein
MEVGRAFRLTRVSAETIDNWVEVAMLQTVFRPFFWGIDGAPVAIIMIARERK